MSIGEEVVKRIKRAKRANFQQDPNGKCICCGKAFQNCEHSMMDVRMVCDAIQALGTLGRAR